MRLPKKTDSIADDIEKYCTFLPAEHIAEQQLKETKEQTNQLNHSAQVLLCRLASR